MSNPSGTNESTFTVESGSLICDHIAEGKSIVTISKMEGMPSYRTIRKWISDIEVFSKMYEKAKLDQADFLADEIIDIANDSSQDWDVNDQGKKVVDKEHIQRSRLKVDARKWVASKLKPKKWGEFARTEISGPDGGPIQFSIADQIKAKFDSLTKDADAKAD